MVRLPSVVYRSGGALCIVAVATLAAALGHIAIDAIGDVALAHDTYDDVAHDSRTVMGVVALFMLLAGATRSLYEALHAALGRRSALGAFAIASVPRFVAGVLVLAIPLLLGMEALDAAAAGRPVDDLGDLFGGSIALGLGTALFVGLVVAFAAVGALGVLCSTRLFVFRTVGSFLALRRRDAIHSADQTRGRRAPLTTRLLLIRHATKRGPPLNAPASAQPDSSHDIMRSFHCFPLVCARAAHRHFFSP